MSVDIRSATDNDVPLIRELAFSIWPSVYAPILSKEQIEYMMDAMYSEEELQSHFAAGHKYLIALRDEKPVGFAGYCKRENGKWHLNKIYISNSEKGKGTGRKIINHIIQDISSKNAHCLGLNVNRHNRAKGFYEHLGFKVVGKEDIAIGNGYFMNDYVMEKCW